MAAMPPDDIESSPRAVWTAEARRVMVLLVLVNAGSQGLQGLMAPITQELQSHLNVSLATVGSFQTFFLITFALATTFWGVTAKRFSRRRALICASLLWGGCCGLVTFAQTPLQFAVGLCLAAVGNAAIIPLTYSVAMAVVPREDRATSLGWLATGQAASMGLAFLAGGGLVENFGWQAPFWVFAGSGMLAAALLSFYLPENAGSETSESDLARTERDPAIVTSASLLHRFTSTFSAFRQRSCRHVVTATVCSSVADGAIAFWFIAMLRRDHHLSSLDATLLTVGLFVTQLPGGVVCGKFADAVERKWRHGRIQLSVVFSAIAGVLYFGMLLIPWSALSASDVGCVLFCGLAVAGAFITAALPPLLFNAATEISPQPQREIMISAVSVSRIVGRALGVQCVGLIGTLLNSSALSLSIGIVTLFFLPSAFLLHRLIAADAEVAATPGSPSTSREAVHATAVANPTAVRSMEHECGQNGGLEAA